MTLEVGDRVVISRDSQYYGASPVNPEDNVEGTVIFVDRDCVLPVEVQWDNDTANSYNHEDLRFIGGVREPITSIWEALSSVAATSEPSAWKKKYTKRGNKFSQFVRKHEERKVK